MSEAQTSAETELSTKDRLVLYITRPDETEHCHFWVGLFKKGKIKPPKLLSQNDIGELFELAAEEGLDDQEPILIANTQTVPAKTFYFWPLAKEGLDLAQTGFLVDALKETIDAIKPTRAGFYFSPNLINKYQLKDLLKAIIVGLQDTSTKEFYFLVGSNGVSTTLNIALEIKEALASTKEVLVFH